MRIVQCVMQGKRADECRAIQDVQGVRLRRDVACRRVGRAHDVVQRFARVVHGDRRLHAGVRDLHPRHGL